MTKKSRSSVHISKGTKRYNVYLAGPNKVWSSRFKRMYSDFFGERIKLFEPGYLTSHLLQPQIQKDHARIPEKISQMCMAAISSSDAFLTYIKPYKTRRPMGIPCVDSSWEIGCARGQEKPVIALLDQPKDIDFWETSWMLNLSVNAVLTTKKNIMEKMRQMERFLEIEIIYCKKEQLDNELANCLDRIIMKNR